MSGTYLPDENYSQLEHIDTPVTVEETEKTYKPLFCFYGMKSDLNFLLGNVLTIIDASVVEPVQRKAMKDLMKNKFALQACQWREQMNGITLFRDSSDAVNTPLAHSSNAKNRGSKARR